MRTVVQSNTAIITGLLSLLFVAMLIIHAPANPRMWLYPLVRQGAKLKVDYETRHMAVRETEHFVIKYSEVDANVVGMVSQAAESAYAPVTSALGYTPSDKTIIVIYHDKGELRQAFGWSGSESAMGVYWGGVIQLLSPDAWMKDSSSTQEFIRSGPMVHEYTHLVFDYLTDGNYPRWFTEGLAQYVEYRVNHYEWLTTDNSLDHKLYSMAEMDTDFDNLDNQSLAYRESLAAVRYIAEVHGEAVLNRIIQDLKAGQSMNKAIRSNLGMDYATYEIAWHNWAVSNMASVK